MPLCDSSVSSLAFSSPHLVFSVRLHSLSHCIAVIYPFLRLVFLPVSLSLFIMSLSSFSSSLSYIIQASASHSEIKARACVPSKLQTRYLLEGQTGLCPRGFKEAEMHSMTADVGTLQSNLCAFTLHHFSFIFTLLAFFAQVMQVLGMSEVSTNICRCTNRTLFSKHWTCINHEASESKKK